MPRIQLLKSNYVKIMRTKYNNCAYSCCYSEKLVHTTNYIILYRDVYCCLWTLRVLEIRCPVQRQLVLGIKIQWNDLKWKLKTCILWCYRNVPTENEIFNYRAKHLNKFKRAAGLLCVIFKQRCIAALIICRNAPSSRYGHCTVIEFRL